MKKYVRKGECIEINGKLYKAVDPVVFADCKDCVFDKICNRNEEGDVSKDDIPYCSIAQRRDMQDVIFKQVFSGVVFEDEHFDEATKLENKIEKLTEDFVRTYDSADIDKHLRRFDIANKKHESAQKIKQKINKLKDELYRLK